MLQDVKLTDLLFATSPAHTSGGHQHTKTQASMSSYNETSIPSFTSNPLYLLDVFLALSSTGVLRTDSVSATHAFPGALNSSSFVQSIAEFGSSHLSTIIRSNFYYILQKFRFLFYLVWPSETMFPELGEVPRFVAEMFPVFVFISIVEIVIRHLQGKNPLKINQSIASLSAGIFQETFRIKVRSIEVLMYCLVYNNFRLVTLPWNSLWTWWLCYIGVDLGFYWAHRFAHEVNFIWAIHQAHHSSEDFSIISALRQAVLQPFTAWFTYIPLALFVPPQIYLAHLQLSELFMAWLHTEVIDSLGPLEYVLNCPSHHRVHHSRNPEYIDKNYGGMLIIWDRLFGTFKGEDKVNNPPVYGLVHPLESFNPILVQFHTWPVIWRRIREASKWSDKLKVLFYGPGWRPGLQMRLGDPNDIPKLIRPVKMYDPIVKHWQNAYVIVHFTMILLLYHELTIHQANFTQSLLTANIVALLISITTLGMILDNRRLCSLYELARCCLFFAINQYLSPVIRDSFLRIENTSEQQYQALSLIIALVFALSICINAVHLTIQVFLTLLEHLHYASTKRKIS